jgi:hypothetical protein
VTAWIKITYERNDYVINLARIATFCRTPSGRISFAVPDSNITIVLNPQSNPEAYQQILDYIKKQTGYSLP